MAQQHINTSTPNDGLGDTLRDSQVKAESNFNELYANKVDKVTGKELSDNNFSDVDKAKLDSLDPLAGTQSDWNQGDNLEPDYIKNKPENISEFFNDAEYVTPSVIDGLEEKVNKISEITNYSEILYPNEKAVHDLADTKLNITDLPSNLTLYPTTTASAIGGYFKMVTSPDDPDFDSTAVNVSTGSITTTAQLISSLVAPAGTIIGQPGIINITTIGNIRRVSGSGTADFYFELYHRNLAGTETFIGVSNPTIPITNSVYGQFSTTAVWNDGTFLDTDTIVIKYYANRIAGGVNPVYEFQFGGLTPVRSIVPVAFNVLAGDYELKENKQNSLTADGTGVKYPTVDAVNKVVQFITPEQFGAVGDGVTNDSPAIQAAINSLANGGVIEFKTNKEYLIGTPILLTYDNVQLNGNGCDFISGLPITTDISNTNTFIRTVTTTRSTTCTVTADIAVNSRSVTLSNVTNVNIGDIIQINTTKTNSVGLKLGIYQRITGIAGNVVYFGFSVTDSLLVSDITTVVVYKTNENISINDINFRFITNSGQQGLSLQNVFNCNISGLNAYGGGGNFGLIAFSISGVKIVADDIYADGFLDIPRLSYGYGVNVSGHDIYVKNSLFNNCKHGITAGSNDFVSTDITYDGNTTTNGGGTSTIDAHSTCYDVNIINNNVYGVTQTGIWLRGKRGVIKNNVIIGSSNTDSSRGITIHEAAKEDIVIEGNYIRNVAFGIKFESAGEQKATRILNNDISEVTNGVFFTQIRFSDLVISGNKIKANGIGILILEGDNGFIDNNDIEYSVNTNSNIGINVNKLTVPVTGAYTHLYIRHNKIKTSNGSAGAGVRIYSNISPFRFQENSIVSSVTKLLIEPALVFSGDNIIKSNIGVDILPSITNNAYYIKQQLIHNSNPSTGTVSYWTCTQTGQNVTTIIPRNTVIGLGQVRYLGTHIFTVTTAGTTAVSEPTFTYTIGATTTDGTVVWTCVNTKALFTSSSNIDISLYAQINSPTFTGIPTAPTAITGTNTTQIATTAFVNSSKKYKTYIATLNQTGTSSPTATVIDNELSGVIVWTYSVVGGYVGTLTGAFTNNKTSIIFSNGQSSNGIYGGYRVSDNAVSITSSNSTTGISSDGLIWNATIEIRVYN